MDVLFLVPATKKHGKVTNIPRDLVYGCWCKGKRIAGVMFPPVSQVQTATVARDAGHSVTFIDAAAEGMPIEDILNKVHNFQVVVMQTSTMTVKQDAEILSLLKKENPNLITIVNGSHPTFEPEHTVSLPGIDIAVRREAEFIVRDLLNNFEQNSNGSWKEVKGIAYLDDAGKPVVNGYYPMIQNLDELPCPDRTILSKEMDYYNPIVKRVPYTTMYSSRGCPGMCTYCSSPPFYGNKVRMRSAEKMLEDLKIIISQGYKEIFFRDENFTSSKKRVMKFCQGIIDQKLDITWIVSSRADYFDKEMIEKMREAGCHMVRIGVETGSSKLLENVKKEVTVDQVREVFKWTHEVGMDTHAHLMIGMPGETLETIQETIDFVREIQPTVITCGICTPYAGTELFEQVRGKYPEIGDGSGLNVDILHTTGFFNYAYTELGHDTLSKELRRVYREFYFRPSYVFNWLRRINNLDELRRVTLAGLKVSDFVLAGDD
jgi:radical SAM superfamily enzyme YgiQ (UPF0313 family)